MSINKQPSLLALWLSSERAQKNANDFTSWGDHQNGLNGRTPRGNRAAVTRTFSKLMRGYFRLHQNDTDVNFINWLHEMDEKYRQDV